MPTPESASKNLSPVGFQKDPSNRAAKRVRLCDGLLTEAKIHAAAPGTKLRDGRGMRLLRTSSGGLWRFRYYRPGRKVENTLSLGKWPDVPLELARERRDEMRRALARGIDPSEQRKAEERAVSESYEAVAREHLSIQAKRLDPGTLDDDTRRLERFVFPFLGSRPIGQITSAELLPVLKRIADRGTEETARRTREVCGRVQRYAIATNRATHDITVALRGALPTPKTESYAALVDPPRVGELLRAIDGYVGQPVVHTALRLAPLVFVRPGELRFAEWAEFDLDGHKPEWRIPGSKMKMREQHIVPLSRQAVELLRALKPFTGAGSYVFPGLRSSARPISNNTLNAALRRIGYSTDEQTAHGFRTVASTLLNEQGWHPDLIELQLAHKERNRVRAAYNKAQRLEERRRMMQAWADYLDALKAGANIVTLHRRAS